MIIKIAELKKGIAKEYNWRIQHGRERVTMHRKGGPKHIYTSEEEYLTEKIDNWEKTIKEEAQNGHLKTLNDLLDHYIRRGSNRTNIENPEN